MKELWKFFGSRKKFWLFPAILVLLLVAALVAVSSGSALAPLVYTLF